MRTLKSFVLIVALALGSFAFATNPSTLKKYETSSISAKVGDLLKNPDIQFNADDEAIVELFLNKDNEMVVLSVETENAILERFIKSRLNYKKVDSEIAKVKKSYRIPLKFVEQS